MPRVSRRSLLIVLIPSLLALMAYSYSESTRILVTRLKLGFDAKIAFLVDTHIHSFGSVEERVLKILDEEKPDVVLHGGDVIDEFTRSLKPVERYLSLIDAEEKYAVLGNHDYWCGKAGELIEVLERCGFKPLLDEVVESRVGRIFGVDWRDSRRYEACSGSEILLAHDPNVALSCRKARLILVGHTHGGLVLGGLTIFSNSAYTRGLYELDGSTLYVSRGLGQMIPFRPTSPLELVIIE